MIGYKGFNNDLTCLDFRYEVGKEYSTSERIALCEHGFHFCENITDCFRYYSQPDARFAKVEALGRVIRADDGSKCVTDRIRILEEIPMADAVRMADSGTGNTGHCNSGDYNSGRYNSGDRNSGDCNTGTLNSGDNNSGSKNSGHCNSGNRNSANWNYGHHNSGFHNPGSWNSGHNNSGYRNSGVANSGDLNSGDQNAGDRNTGERNSGSRNSGRFNSGTANSGNYNSGRYNSGNRNRGNCNSGDWNRSSHNSGCFMSVEPTIMMFNRPSDWTLEKWRRSRANRIMSGCPADYRDTEWIRSKEMTEEERRRHPEHITTGGYLKTITHVADKQAWWDSLPASDKRTVKRLPNFDPDVFYECTGIRA